MNKLKNFSKILILLLICNNDAFAANKDIGVYVSDLLQQFFSIAKNTSFSDDKKVEKVRGLLAQNLDFDWMAKFSIGRFRRGLPASELEDFTAVYKKYLITTYGNAVRGYKGQEVQIKSVQPISDKEFAVKTAIVKPGQDPLIVDYLVRQYGSNYKVFDIVTEGVSLITSQQAEFASLIGSGGLGGLKNDLAAKSQ